MATTNAISIIEIPLGKAGENEGRNDCLGSVAEIIQRITWPTASRREPATR
jgi:hypothetical protein